MTFRISSKETRRRGIAEGRELRLELLAVLGRDDPEVDERQHLAELHRRPLHPAEDGDDLLGGLDLAPLQRLLGPLVGAGHVGRAGSRPADGLPRRRGPDPRQPTDPPGRTHADRTSNQAISSDVASLACISSGEPGSKRSSARATGRL